MQQNDSALVYLHIQDTSTDIPKACSALALIYLEHVVHLKACNTATIRQILQF